MILRYTFIRLFKNFKGKVYIEKQVNKNTVLFEIYKKKLDFTQILKSGFNFSSRSYRIVFFSFELN